MRLVLLLSFLVNLFLLSSCKKYKPADSAFFVKANAISVTTNTAQGSGSHKIVDLWLYVNGKYQGTYPAGNIMPIANKNEPVRINIFAGIKNNGIADTRIFYPFYEVLTIDTMVEAGKTFSRPFTFKYKSSVVFDLIENCDGVGGGLYVKGVDATTIYTASPADCFEKGSIKLSLPGLTYNHARIESSSSFTLQSGSSDIYLELNYKGNTEFHVGLMSPDGTQHADAVVVNPQSEWNKIYIQLSTAVSTIISNKYVVYIEFFKDSSDASTKEVFLDNIKLLHIPQ